MTDPAPISSPRTTKRLRRSICALTFLCALSLLKSQPCRAQTFTVLHSFTGGSDGANPIAGLTLDAAGSLYGTASAGGLFIGECALLNGCGTIFKLKQTTSGWGFTQLYAFHNLDGSTPIAPVTVAADDTLFGTAGGGEYPCGVFFRLQPPQNTCKNALCQWSLSLLYNFSCGYSGDGPGYGSATFDSTGHAYGTTLAGGAYDNGAIYEMTPQPEGRWLEQVDYSFRRLSGGGAEPANAVIFDDNGNMYTTTVSGGQSDCGTVSQVVLAGSGWTGNVLYSFTCGDDGEYPYGGLLFDSTGNLYGTTSEGGGVFELRPSNGGWTYNLLYSFNRCGSWAGVTMDAAGNLYGTAYDCGAYGYGTVFKLTPSDGGWTYTSLHDFTGGSDGARPTSTVTIDPSGNLYGTATYGGSSECSQGCGTVWEITP